MGSSHKTSLLGLTLAAFVLFIACSPSTDNGGDADVSYDAETETGVDGDTDGGDDADVEPVCRANGDQIITAAEAPVAVGASLTFLVNAAGTHPSLDLAGTVVEDVQTWRLDEELAGDRLIDDAVLDPTGQWYIEEAAGAFDDATYASRVPGYESALGVYRVDEVGVALLGLVSQTSEVTFVTYDPPVYVVRFPLEVGESWVEETWASGRVEHVAFNGSETYTITVDAAGDVIVPAGSFPVLRVRTELDRTAGPLSDHRISYAWVAECWGRVAYAGSRSGETNIAFTEAEQLWRLTLRE